MKTWEIIAAFLKRVWQAFTYKETKFDKWCDQYEEENGL